MSEHSGVRTRLLELPAGGTETEVRLEATQGTLLSVAAISGPGAFEPNDAFLEIGIKQDGITNQHIIIVLVDGALSPLGTLSWDGEITLADSCQIYIRGGSSINRPVTLRAWITRGNR